MAKEESQKTRYVVTFTLEVERSAGLDVIDVERAIRRDLEFLQGQRSGGIRYLSVEDVGAQEE
jgi:hypothetical protein